MELQFKALILSVLMLISGSLNTLLSKFQYNTKANGVPDNQGYTERNYEHPWFQTNLMFVGEMTCLIAFAFKVLTRKKGEKDYDSPRKIPGWRAQLFLCIPGLCDFIGTLVSSIGLLWVDSSVYQMLRGSLVIFVGILSRLVLKNKVSYEQWGGIASSAIGITLVSLSSVFGKTATSSDSFHMFLGIAFIIGAQLLSAVQMVAEEYIIVKENIDPLNLVGVEGTFGFIISFIALIVTYFLPGDSGPQHRQEDILDAFKQLSNSVPLVVTTIAYVVSIAFFNFAGASITQNFSATHRTIIDSCRTAVIWIVGIILYYGADAKVYGEPLDYWSITKVDGFVLLIFGAVLYKVTGNSSSESPPEAKAATKSESKPLVSADNSTLESRAENA